MEAIRINVELGKDLHPEHLIKLSDEEDWPMEATLRAAYNGLWEDKKEKLHQSLRSFPPSDCLDIVFSLQSRHPLSFLVHPLLL
jgi:hypothetical protein